MTTIIAGNRHFDVQCIVFDKDGTLIDFNLTWARRTADWIEAMVSRAGQNGRLAREIARTIGFDWDAGRVLSDGPVIVTTAPKLIALAAGEIYKSGLPWHDAENIALETIIATVGADFGPGEIVALGDVSATLKRMKEAGLFIAIATGDDRKPTGETLDALAIRPYVDAIICGDDTLPEKPDAAVLREIGRLTGIDPAHMLMVGDTVNDMVAGRNAGAAGCVGITGSTGDPALLSPYADVLLDRIDQLQIDGDKTATTALGSINS